MRNKQNTALQRKGWATTRMVSRHFNGRDGFRKWPLPKHNRLLRRALKKIEARQRRQAYLRKCQERSS